MIHLNPDEIIVSEIRRHWFIIFARGLAVAVLAALPYFLLRAVFIILSAAGPDIKDATTQFISMFATAIAPFAYFIWLSVLWFFFFLEWTDYYLDVWYLTNERVIDVEQKGLFHREIATLRYKDIQDVTTSTKGVIQTVFNFGDIYIQTAGVNREFILRGAKNPDMAREAILKQASNNDIMR